jgi:hypothetical protein
MFPKRERKAKAPCSWSIYPQRQRTCPAFSSGRLGLKRRPGEGRTEMRRLMGLAALIATTAVACSHSRPARSQPFCRLFTSFGATVIAVRSSRFILAMKLMLMSFGQAASHSLWLEQ